MSGLIVTCKQCFVDYEPSRAEIMQGYSTWSLCPNCRIDPPEAPQSRRANDTTTNDSLAGKDESNEKGADHAASDR